MMNWFGNWVSDIEIEFLLASGIATAVFAVICTFV